MTLTSRSNRPPLLELEKAEFEEGLGRENGTNVIVTTKTIKTWLIQYAEWKFSLRKMGVF